MWFGVAETGLLWLSIGADGGAVVNAVMNIHVA